MVGHVARRASGSRIPSNSFQIAREIHAAGSADNFSSTVSVCVAPWCVDSLRRGMGSAIQQEINFDYKNVIAQNTFIHSHWAASPTHNYKSAIWIFAFEHFVHDFSGRIFIRECFMCVVTAFVGETMLDLFLICIHAILLITVQFRRCRGQFHAK